MRLIAILGEARTGKDHAAAAVVKLLNGLGVPSVVRPIADSLRDLCPRRINETKEQWSVRLVEQGAMCAERYGYSFLADKAIHKALYKWDREHPSINAEGAGYPVVILPDVRRLAEFDLVVRRDPKALCIRLNARPEVRRQRMGEEEWKRYLNGRGKDATETALREFPEVGEQVFDIPSNNEEEFGEAIRLIVWNWASPLVEF